MKLDVPIHFKRRSFSELREPIIEPEDGSNKRKDLVIFLFTVFCCLAGIMLVFTSLYFYTESIDRFEDRLIEKDRANLSEALNLVEDKKISSADDQKVNPTEAPESPTPSLNCKCGLDYDPGLIPWQVKNLIRTVCQ